MHADINTLMGDGQQSGCPWSIRHASAPRGDRLPSQQFPIRWPELRTALDRWGGRCEYGRLVVAWNGDAVVVLDCDIADLLIASELYLALARTRSCCYCVISLGKRSIMKRRESFSVL